MTALDTSSDSDAPGSSTAKPPPAPPPPPPQNSQPTTTLPRARNAPPRRERTSPWCCAALWTILIVVFAYVALHWTDPEQISLRQRAWQGAMRKLQLEKEVVHASRYSPEFKFRPAASPVVREKLQDGRTRVRGGRPGDDIDPPPPTVRAKPVAPKRKKKRRAGGTY